MRSIELVSQLVTTGDELLGQGRLNLAAEAYIEAVAVRPKLPATWYNLAWVQRAQRQFDAALSSYEQAIIHGLDRPEEARLNRATIFYDHLADTDRAIEELHAAILTNSHFTPAWLNLGNIAEEHGDVGGAEAAYRNALNVEPHNGRAHARLAAIAIATGNPSAAIERLKGELDHAPAPLDRAEMLFALGTALDASQQFDDAFSAFEAANWISGTLASTRYDPMAQERLVDQLISAYPAPPDCIQHTKNEAPTPVFICGMFRSGSTLIEQILGRHSEVYPAGELELIPAMTRDLRPYPAAAVDLAEDQRLLLRNGYLKSLPTSRFVTDKRCDNFLHIGLIKTLFPDARIVHTVREPLDNLLSIYFLQFGEAITYGHNLGETAHFYKQYQRLMAHWMRLFPNDIVTIDYDQLVATPEAVVANLLEDLGLPWEDACLAVGAAGNSVRTASTWQVRAPLHTRSSLRWRNYHAYLGEIVEVLRTS